ncbi:MAG: HAD family hydrolase [Chloroflexi bacterium]|nr:HAD family hydrolase [Chloroflexota bacterium]
MPEKTRLVFLLDVDNTLLDNDFVKDDLGRQMQGFLSPPDEERFWALYEEVRNERDVVDFPLTLERFQEGFSDATAFDRLRHLLMDYRFDRHLYPHALETIAHLRTIGDAAIVSDGDPVFQPKKIAEAGITRAVGGKVFIFTHKERSIVEVIRQMPGDKYIMVDDKRRIIASLKRDDPARMAGVHVRQGHYAAADAHLEPAPDVVVDRIGDLRTFSAGDFIPG